MLTRLTNDITPLPLGQVHPDPAQPRKHMDGIDALAASIVTEGLLQPITVALTGDDSFTIVTGERRYLAHQAAGLDTIDAIVVEPATPAETFLSQLRENIARADMTVEEEATAIYRAVTHYNADRAELAQNLSRSTQWVSEMVTLGTLPKEILTGVGSAVTKEVALKIAALDVKDQAKAFKVAANATTRQAKANIKRLEDQRAGKKTGSANDPDAKQDAKALDALMKAVARYTKAAPNTQAAVNARTNKLDKVADLAATMRRLSTDLDNAIAARRAVVQG